MATTDTTELLWRGRDTATRGPKPVLSLEQITAAAVAIADQHGIGAVSMQAVADAVGFTKMSLYRHVHSKDELLAVMVEDALGEPPTFTPDLPWRSRINTWAERLAQVWRRHPWIPEAAVGHRPMGPRETSWSEYVLRALEGLRLSPSERVDVAFLLFGHLRNTQSLDAAGTQAWNEPGHRQLMTQRPEDFPAMLKVTTTPASDDFGRALGLRLILDGVQTLHDSRGG